jgi:hypothetical protein
MVELLKVIRLIESRGIVEDLDIHPQTLLGFFVLGFEKGI